MELIRHDSGLHRMQVFQMRIERAIHRAISQLITLRKSRRRKMGNLQRQRARKNSAQVMILPQVVGKEQNEIGRNKTEVSGVPRLFSAGFTKVPPPARPLQALRTSATR